MTTSTYVLQLTPANTTFLLKFSEKKLKQQVINSGTLKTEYSETNDVL